MRWLVDECVAAEVVSRLRAGGHYTVYMAESGPRSVDIDIIQTAQQDGRVLLTEDKDFGELVFRRHYPVPGLVLLRIDPRAPRQRWERLEAAMAHFGDGLLGRYVVVEQSRFRSRPLLSIEP
jgi:predicted nuclease of predicted toxin-antitoxin system